MNNSIPYTINCHIIARQVSMTTCDNRGMTKWTTTIWKLDLRETWEQTCASNSDIGGDVSHSDSCFNLVDVLSSFPSCPWKTNLQIFLWYFNIHWIFWEQRHDFNPRKACLCIIKKSYSVRILTKIMNWSAGGERKCLVFSFIIHSMTQGKCVLCILE